MFGTGFIAKKCVDYRVFDGKHCIYTVKTMFWVGFLYLCLSWTAALDHRKIEENTGNRAVKGIGRCLKYLSLEIPHGVEK